MDTKMEDVNIKPPTPPTSEPTDISTLDGWIEGLMSCKQLSEADVQRLCDKVRLSGQIACRLDEALKETWRD